MDGSTSTGERGGREYDRVAAELRARIADGTYPLNGRLPTQRELAKELKVSRDTLQRALRDLKNERWIESRQGSGSRVVWKQRIHSPRSEKEPGYQVTLGGSSPKRSSRPKWQAWFTSVWELLGH